MIFFTPVVCCGFAGRYPVLIFHDGLSAASRALLVHAAPEQPTWFAYVDAFFEVPRALQQRLDRQARGRIQAGGSEFTCRCQHVQH